MMKLTEHKDDTAGKPIEKLPLPSRVYIPLAQHLGKACLPKVKIGDKVLTGEEIGNVEAAVYAPVHASISGKISAIEQWPHPLLGRASAIVIDGDGLDTPSRRNLLKEGEADKLTPAQIRQIVFQAGIVGMGGAAFPTHIKLNPLEPVDTLIINGAECEPYLTGDYRLMVEEAGRICQGIEISARCLGVKRVFIAIEDNKPEAIKVFNSVCAKGGHARCPASFKVSVLKSQYPQGGEKQLIKNILGREVPCGRLPFAVGVVVQNVATAFSVYEAVFLGKPLYERVVTVKGGCITNPKNLLVRIGTPIKELIDSCGPLKEAPQKIIIGGPMMGIAQFDIQAPVIKSTTAVLLLDTRQMKIRLEELSCIRCGACIRECPAGLMPCLINLAAIKEAWQEAKFYGAMDCIECGLCNYVCPARRRIVQLIKRVKLEAAR
ncbi:MAG: electron transport complex subunit RsxC [Candidatus Omnitrophota bacterium]